MESIPTSPSGDTFGWKILAKNLTSGELNGKLKGTLMSNPPILEIRGFYWSKWAIDCLIWKTYIFQIFNIQPPRLLTNLKNESFPNKTINDYIFEISLFHWSKCTIECAIYSILILNSDQARGVVFTTGKNLFSSQGSQLMKTGFSLCGNTTQGKPCSGPVLALRYRTKILKRLPQGLLF